MTNKWQKNVHWTTNGSGWLVKIAGEKFLFAV